MAVWVVCPRWGVAVVMLCEGVARWWRGRGAHCLDPTVGEANESALHVSTMGGSELSAKQRTLKGVQQPQGR
jgi:hypothetical protein